MSYRSHSEGCYGNVRRLQRVHSHRSNRAKRIDESLRAPLAKSDEEWLSQPNRFDIPDVDTPKHREELERKIEPIIQHSSLTQVRANLARHKLYGNTGVVKSSALSRYPIFKNLLGKSRHLRFFSVNFGLLRGFQLRGFSAFRIFPQEGEPKS